MFYENYIYEKNEYKKIILDYALKILDEPIKLKSGIYSRIYVDMRQAFQDVEISKRIAEYLSQHIKSIEELSGQLFNGFVGVPEAGSYIANKVTENFHSYGRNVKILQLRSMKKNHGDKSLYVFKPTNEKKLCGVEDVVTTGGSVESMSNLVNFAYIVSCVDRSGTEINHINQIPYSPAVKIEEVLSYGIEINYFNKNQLKIISNIYPDIFPFILNFYE